MIYARTILPIACVLLAASSIDAQEWARKMFEKKQHDFGVVAKGTEAICRFEFQNIYEEDVHIQSISSSCGCTTATIEKRDLKTWEKSEVVAKFNTVSFRDQKQATLTVRIDKPFPAEVQLVVRGFIRSDVSFDPGVIEFGEIPQGTKKQQTVRVSRHGSATWAIKDVTTTFDLEKIRVGLHENFRGNGVVSYEMLVELQDDLEPGYFRGELFVITNEGEQIRYPLPFNGKVVPALQLSPEVLTIGPLQPGQEIERKVILKAEKPFRITGIESSDKCLTVDADEEANRLQILRVKYVAGTDTGKHEYEATIQTDIGPAVFKTIATVGDQ